MCAELITNTHSQIVVGAAAAAAGDNAIGAITLPAGGPWIIHDVFCQTVSVTPTAAESVGGHFRFDAASGDLSPAPAPSRFPVYESGSSLGATIDRGQCPLNLFPVNWKAEGKAIINCIYANALISTVGAEVVMGLMYGKTIPEKRRFKFSDVVRIGQAVAADTAVGTITISESASRIVGVCGILSQDDVLVTVEPLTGFFRLASDDVKLPPMQLPFNNVYGGGLGALIQGGNQGRINYIPVDIPITGGARINAFVDLNLAVTNAADCEIFIAYE